MLGTYAPLTFENANVPVAPGPTEPLPPGGGVIFLLAREEEVLASVDVDALRALHLGELAWLGQRRQHLPVDNLRDRAWATTPAPSGGPAATEP